MALVRYPEGQQRSGRTGGTVYSHNRAGPYTRAASIPVNPQTQRQNAVRAWLTGLALSWYQTLTQIQRDAWDQYASQVPLTNRLGMVHYATGMNMYIRGNVPRLQGGLAVRQDAPLTYLQADAVQNLGATASEGTQIVTVSWSQWEAWEGTDGYGMIVQLGIPQNASRKFFGGPWRFAGAILADSVTPPASPVALPVSPFVIGEGQRLWIQARMVTDDGRLGDTARFDFLCAV